MPKIILCATHGPIQENIPWAQPHAQITYRFEHAVLIYSQLMTQKAAAGILNIPTSTLSDLLHRSITRLREGHVIERLTNIGIDEIAYAKGKKYATIIYDLKTSRVVWVGKGKGRKTVDEFFRTLTRKQKQEIKWASCDLSETYINAIKYHCKWATLVIDRFHIVKALNGAMDKVRLEQWREVAGKKKKALKGLRWLLWVCPGFYNVITALMTFLKKECL